MAIARGKLPDSDKQAREIDRLSSLNDRLRSRCNETLVQLHEAQVTIYTLSRLLTDRGGRHVSKDDIPF